MKNRILLLHSLMVALIAPVKTHAMAGELKEPGLAWLAATADTLRTRVATILNDKDCKFLGGHFINASTTLEYGGRTDSLNRLLSRVAECEGVRVKVSFTQENRSVAWTVRHNAWSEPTCLFVRVNLAASVIEATHLEMPVFGKGGEPPVSPKAPSPRQ